MAGGRHRRFNLIDAMTILAAMAVGFALDRLWMDTRTWDDFGPGGRWARNDLPTLVSAGILLSVPPAAMLTVATLALHLRHPRDHLRRVCRRPGMAACFAAISGLVIVMGLVGCAILGKAIYFNVLLGTDLPLMVGTAVAAVWSLSVLNGRWRPSPCWLDRLGRLVGTYWLVSVAAYGWLLTFE